MKRRKTSFPHVTHPLYATWCAMKQRCYNPKHTFYHLYGGKGIVMCDRWRDSFACFCEDVGERPSLNHTIDRYPDKNGNYSPENFRWATKREQNLNRNMQGRGVFRFKELEECCRIINGLELKGYCDLIGTDEEMKQVINEAKEKFQIVRKLKHKRGHYQLFVK